MSVLTELFVSPPNDAATYEKLAGSNFERVQIGELTNLDFEVLWAILLGESWNAKRHFLPEVTTTGDAGTFQFPIGFINALLLLDAASIRRTAILWAGAQEISAPPDAAALVIASLARLARSAAAKNHGLFLWVSL